MKLWPGAATRIRFTPVGAVVLIVVLAVAGHPPEGDPRLAAIMWSVVLGLLLVGVVWPLVDVSRVRVDARGPTDMTVGDEAPVDITLHGRAGRLEVRALDPPSAWFRCGVPSSGELPHVADRRGVYGALRIDLRSTGLLGVMQAERRQWVVLPREVSVAPQAVPVRWVPRSLSRVAHDLVAPGSSAASGDVARSVRPYVVGDPAHLVHWPSTARTGGLVVREMEPPVTTGQAVVVDLRAPAGREEQAEAAASRAAGLARAVLGGGGRLLMITNEMSGPVVGLVGSALEVGRRLARAVPGQPPAVPPGWPVEVVAADIAGLPGASEAVLRRSRGRDRGQRR